MAIVTLTVKGVLPYDGVYEVDTGGQELTNRDWGWIKQFSGYLPGNFEDAIRGGDAEFWCAFALIALHRHNKITRPEAMEVFDRLVDAPYSAIGVRLDLGPDEEGTDAGPPVSSSNGNAGSSGDGSPTSSETSTETPPVSGIPGLAFSQSGPAMSAT